MNYKLIRDVVDLIRDFEQETAGFGNFTPDVDGFRNWLSGQESRKESTRKLNWEGRESGRSAESMIATLFVHMNHYARNYFRSAIHGSEFSTPEEVIYLIVLRFNSGLSKMELIKKNVHDKPVGMQIINRLIAKGWITQTRSDLDKRSMVISPTSEGLKALDNLMDKVRHATRVVTGDLTNDEKMNLIELLQKLNNFHLQVYERNYDSAELLQKVVGETQSLKN